MTDRTVVYRIQADVAQAKAQVAALGASVKKSADDMTSATKEGAKFRQGLDSLGGAAGKVGLVAAVGLGAAVKKAADFDQAMSKVQAATHESAASMDSLRQAALDAGAETAFSATEAAAGIENLAKAGVETAEILDGGLAGALALAAAGEMEVADAAEAAAGAMAQFKLDGSQVPHIADLMAAAAGKAQGEVSDMVMALKQGGTVAAQTGLSLEETTGALAAMAEQSLLGSDAGTSFKTMLSSLTPNSEKAAKAMEQYNIHAFDAQGNFIGMTELAGQLESGLGGLTNEQRAMALETIFGSDAVRAASIIYDNGAEGIAEWTANVNDAGYAAETAAIKQDNLRGDLEKLGGALETALIGTGSGAQGPLRSLTQSLEDAVNAYNRLGDGAKSGIAVTLGATALLGGGLFVFSKAVQSIAATRVAMTQLGVTSTAVKGKLAATAAFMVGPWGLAFAGATVLLGDHLAQQAKTAGYVDVLTAALEDQTGAQTRNAIATNLNEEGWLEYAESIGVSADTVIDAALGSADAMEVLRAAADQEAGGFFSFGTDSFTDDAAQLVENVEAQSAAQKQAQKEARLLAEANGETGAAAAGAASATNVLTGATSDLGGAMTSAESAAEDFKSTLDSLNAALDGRATIRDYEAALDDFTGSLKENGNTFDINTKKGRDNQAALDSIARSALDVAEKMDGADRQKFLSNAISDLRTMGENMGLPKSEVRALIELLREANEVDVSPKIDIRSELAMSKLYELQNFKIGDKTVTIHTVRTGGGDDFISGGHAAGGPIYGPGTATSDSIPAMLSDGEYVIRAAAVQQYGVSFFDRANSMRLAGGGSADKKRRPQGGFDADGETSSTSRQFIAFLNGMLDATADQARAAQIQVRASEIGLLAAQDQADAATQARDNTQQLRDSLAGSVSGQFSNSLTGGGLAGLSRTLGKDIAGGSAMDDTLRALVGAGLDTTGASSGLFKELAASNDLKTASELLADPSRIAGLEAQFAQRESINAGRGEFAASVSFDALLAQQTAAASASDARAAALETQLQISNAHLEALQTSFDSQAQQIGEIINDTAANSGRSNPRGR